RHEPPGRVRRRAALDGATRMARRAVLHSLRDRKSTRLNSSHVEISYAVFCLKKKKNACRHERQRAHIAELYGAAVWETSSHEALREREQAGRRPKHAAARAGHHRGSARQGGR